MTIDALYNNIDKNNFYIGRISQVYRIVIDRLTNEKLCKELILDNHSEVMYDYSLIPKEQIRNDDDRSNKGNSKEKSRKNCLQG